MRFATLANPYSLTTTETADHDGAKRAFTISEMRKMSVHGGEEYAVRITQPCEGLDARASESPVQAGEQ